MEQHYIVIYGAQNSPVGETKIISILIEKYPGNPHLLLLEIISQIVSEDITISKQDVVIYNIIKVFEK